MSWTIQSNSTNAEQLLLEESLFFTGNGYLGVRGNLEENDIDAFDSIRGTYINGFYDHVPISYGEKLHGFPETQQKLLNIIDAQTTEIWVGTGKTVEKFSLKNGTILAYKRSLYVDKGYTERYIHWRSKHGYELNIHLIRLTSFSTKNLFSQFITLEPIGKEIPIKIISKLNGNVKNYTNENDPRVGNDHKQRLMLTYMKQIESANYIELKTLSSHLSVAALAELTVLQDDVIYEYEKDDGQMTISATFLLRKKVAIDKRTFYGDTRRYTDLFRTLTNLKKKLSNKSFKEIKDEQYRYLQEFWKKTDIIITGNEEIQEAIRFNLFHILQSAGQDGMSNIAAKGLSGEGYEGHYFWDTEIYLLPVFTMTNPEMAKQLLMFRYNTLRQAKERALELGHKQGALFPWRTIAGTECSSFFPAGTAQYHISADIAYSYIQYFLATNDIQFMKDAGAEVIIETARLWLEVGHYHDGNFRIDAVTGPDEYTCIVNNNYYTNVMAKNNLIWAVKISKRLSENDPNYWKALSRKLALSNNELNAFQQAAINMYLPIDKKLQINPQDDTFLQKKQWTFESTPKERYPLLLHYHPLTIYRYQVCKQADTVLAHLLMEDEQSEEVMKNSYHYYEKITSHDSSLSSCVFSMMASRIGNVDKAFDYYVQTSRLDLDNTQGNTKDGLHIANMGGAWMGIVIGFAGMRIKESGLYFRPQLPKEWSKYTFRLHYRSRILQCTVTERSFHVKLLEGNSLTIYVWDQEIEVNKKESI